MRRAPYLLAVTVAAALAGGAVGGASAQDTGPPKLSASLAACETGGQAIQRFAVFTGSMPALPGTRRMAMRFVLQTRGSDAVVRRISAPKFGHWNRSRRGVSGFVYTKRVTQLEQGRWYRAVVRFRWYDEDGQIQRRAKRVTSFCHQPDQRANLELVSLGASKRGRYLVTLVNTGAAPARESSVAVEPRPEAEARRPVPPLAPGERTTVVVDAEPCEPGSVVVVQLDRGKDVDESREDDNRVESDCPSADRVG